MKCTEKSTFEILHFVVVFSVDIIVERPRRRSWIFYPFSSLWSPLLLYQPVSLLVASFVMALREDYINAVLISELLLTVTRN